LAPLRSVISILPSGRNAMAHGLLSRPTIVSTVKGGEAFCGAGAFVWPGNAGFGAGKSDAFGACARRGSPSAIASRQTAKLHANFLMDPPSVDRRQVTRSGERRQPRGPVAAARFSAKPSARISAALSAQGSLPASGFHAIEAATKR